MQIKVKGSGIDIAKIIQIGQVFKNQDTAHEDGTISEDAVVTIKRPDKFEKSKVDKIINFNPSTAHKIDTDGIDVSVTFALENKKEAQKLAKKL